MKRDSYGGLVTAALGFAGLIACAPALATPVSYTVEPEQSTLTLSGSWNGARLWGKPAAGLQTTYSGTIQAVLGDGSFQLTGAELDAMTGERARPRGLGRPGTQVADYGGYFRFSEPCLRGNLNAALRNVTLDLASVPMPVSGGTFDAALASLAVDGVMDYAGAGLLHSQFGAGRTALAGAAASNTPAGPGSLATTGALQTLTLPVRVTFPVVVDSPMADAYDRFDFTLTGTIVATRAISGGTSRPAPDVPEPSTLVLLALGMVAVGFRRRR